MTKPTRSLTDLEQERAVPWGDPGLFAWHTARYAFARPLAAGARVLDVGSGEGYGAALLAERAREVVGVDYAPTAVEHARQTHRAANLSYRVADAQALPSDLVDFDLATCFEVIEHLDEPANLVASLCRAVRPGGRVVISTPNRAIDRLYESLPGGASNPYHVSLLSAGDLRALLAPHFRICGVYGQSVRGSRLHSILKALDVANLRHHVVRSRRVQRAMGGALGVPELPAPETLRFSRWLASRSPIVVVVAERR